MTAWKKPDLETTIITSLYNQSYCAWKQTRYSVTNRDAGESVALIAIMVKICNGTIKCSGIYGISTCVFLLYEIRNKSFEDYIEGKEWSARNPQHGCQCSVCCVSSPQKKQWLVSISFILHEILYVAATVMGGFPPQFRDSAFLFYKVN